MTTEKKAAELYKKLEDEATLAALRAPAPKTWRGYMEIENGTKLQVGGSLVGAHPWRFSDNICNFHYFSHSACGLSNCALR
mmetsp:Transcript_38272/g.61405  ORF Transcript_38272/g.61405 Transcript_38272/m.61405 type:complete len:81 (+) Transcript_38272:87-329(+)